MEVVRNLVQIQGEYIVNLGVFLRLKIGSNLIKYETFTQQFSSKISFSETDEEVKSYLKKAIAELTFFQ